MMNNDFQMSWHSSDDYPEWGSAPRYPLVCFDMAHQGEWMDSVIGPDVVTGTPMIYHIVRCELCIATHVWPLPSQDSLSRYYAERFYQEDKPDYVARYEADRKWWECCGHEPILEACTHHLRVGSPGKDQIRFLDIGAGPGIALDCAKRRGWGTWAVEPNQELSSRCAARGHVMMKGILEEALPTSACVDTLPWPAPWHVLYLYEVLEHQICPEEFLLRCYDLLAPGGVLAVVVPNDWNILQLEACKKLHLPHWFISPPQHLWMFTPKCLQLLLRRCGFDIVDARATFPLEKFLLEGRWYVGNDVIGRACHQERMTYELEAVATGKWPQLEQTYRINMTKRIGR